ncbi:MAG: Crp/Fnr family transcriptional regulator [Abitibacteriaceae bacterium]|nr:Crp/Fnr family transcriptional regulator [Abditibacteriaceae bacterium]MBV9866163.1 Crp/Fnr family transcriptional regulator [Abditibacteriaceae bacterium]
MLHHVYFLAGGVASMVAESKQGIAVEVGMVGREGLVGASALLGKEAIPLRAMMQVPGNGWRIPVDVLREEFRRRSAFQELALRYIQVLLTQSAQNTLCNRLHTVDQRLSRWLLMIRDRVDSDQLYITHEFVADLLGVRRAGVTVALGRFRDAGMIHHTRGYVTLLDMEALEKTTCECYSVISESFQRLFE